MTLNRRRRFFWPSVPKADFTNEEVDLAAKADWHIVDLGPRILRIETAAVLLLAIVANKWQDDFNSRLTKNIEALETVLYYSAGGLLGSWPSWRVSAYMSWISWTSQGRCLMFRRANMRAWAVIITSGGASVTWPNDRA